MGGESQGSTRDMELRPLPSNPTSLVTKREQLSRPLNSHFPALAGESLSVGGPLGGAL